MRDIKLKDIPNMNDVVLMLAGDVGGLLNFIEGEDYFSELGEKFQDVIFIAGNHDFYSATRSIDLIEKDINNTVEDNFSAYYYLRNSCITYISHKDKEQKEYKLVGTVLWSDIDKGNPIAKLEAKSIADFQHIRKRDGTCITPDDFIRMHNADKEFLNKAIEQNSIVITHYAPISGSMVNPAGSKLSGFFCSDLSRLIFDKAPKLWIFGHTHFPYDEVIGKTRLINNPLRDHLYDVNLRAFEKVIEI
jgi:predicted phosphohydrolase